MKKNVIILLICITFYACSKKNDSGNYIQIAYTYPTVSYTLHTNFGNRVYDHSYFSFFKGPTGNNGWISWDSSTTQRLFYPCQADKRSAFFRFDLYDSNLIGLGFFSYPRTNLSFALPSINSFTNHYDTSVLMDIGDTTYIGYAIVSVNVTSVENNKYAEPSSIMSGTFNMSGAVSSGILIDGAYRLPIDSIYFLSSGTFTNMPYFQPPQ